MWLIDYLPKTVRILTWAGDYLIKITCDLLYMNLAVVWWDEDSLSIF